MRPQVTPETATDLAITHWHLAGPLNCTQLDGYDDRNYRLTGERVAETLCAATAAAVCSPAVEMVLQDKTAGHGYLRSTMLRTAYQRRSLRRHRTRFWGCWSQRALL